MLKKIRINAASWSNTKAWMVDWTGLAVPVENHVQKGEPVESQLDEYGIACALRYGKLSHSSEYYNAAAVLVWEELLDNLTVDDMQDEIDVEEELSYILEPENVPLYPEALQLPEFIMTVEELLSIYQNRRIEQQVDEARRSLRTLFERLMMRVRVGGVINTTSAGSTDIYFRIPDSVVNGWYSAIGNFLYDHPQYAGFTVHIYEEADTAGDRRELESYTDAKEFLDLHSSHCVVSEYKSKRLNSAYKRRAALNARFMQFLGSC